MPGAKLPSDMTPIKGGSLMDVEEEEVGVIKCYRRLLNQIDQKIIIVPLLFSGPQITGFQLWISRLQINSLYIISCRVCLHFGQSSVPCDFITKMDGKSL